MMQSKGITGTHNSLNKTFNKLLAGVMSVSLIFQSGFVYAQVVADPSAGAANRPNIDAASNGVPLVNIATPNGQGLSHNKYTDFNVGAPGLILNNSNSLFGTSHLGGLTAGNANLFYSGSAKVILNEVTSGKRSALGGMVEVFGRKADVIIANPNGITCNGCGFINTPRATLTTGVPDIGLNGTLNGFNVKGGDVTFGPKGANLVSGKGSVDIFDVVSRTIKIDGPVKGHTVGLTAGTGKYDYATRQMKELTDIAGTPEFAIDGSALGALQADRIKIVVTEKGAGVRMRGDMAANAGQLSLSASGKISLNNVFGRDGVNIHSVNNAVAARKVTSKKTVTIKADEGIMLETIGADGDIMVDAGRGLFSSDGDIIGGVNVTLNAQGAIKTNKISAEENLQVNAGQGLEALFASAGLYTNLKTTNGNIVLKEGAKTILGNLILNAESGNIEAKTLFSFNNMTLTAGADLRIGASQSEQILGVLVNSSVKAGGNISAVAGHDLNIVNSAVKADGGISLVAANNVNILALETKTSSFTESNGGLLGNTSQSIHKDMTTVYGSSIRGNNDVDIQAGNDVTIAASDINAGTFLKSSDIHIIANGNVAVVSEKNTTTSKTTTISGLLTFVSGYEERYDEKNIASNLTAMGSVFIKAAGQVQISGSALTANDYVWLNGASATITGAREEHHSYSEQKTTGFGVGSGDGFLSTDGEEIKKTTSKSIDNIATLIKSRDEVRVTAEKADINVIGSKIAADFNVIFTAANDVNILSGYKSSSITEITNKTGSGVQFDYQDGSVSVDIGYSTSEKTRSEDSMLMANAILTAGDVVFIRAKQNVNLQAADMSGESVDIRAGKDVNLLAFNAGSNLNEAYEKQFFGATLTVGSGMLSSLQDFKNAIDNLGKGGLSGNGIANILAGIIKGNDGVGKIKDGISDIKQLVGGTDFTAPSLGDDGELSGPSILDKGILLNGSLTVGGSYSKAQTSTITTTPIVTTIKGGQSVIIEALEGDINSVGTKIDAGKKIIWDWKGNITLKAGKNLNLASAEGAKQIDSTLVSSDMKVGIDHTRSIIADGQYTEASTKTDNTYHINTQVTGTGDVTLSSVGDTNLKGTVVSGESIVANIGGNLNIESLLEKENYSRQSDTYYANYGKIGISGGWQHDASTGQYESVYKQSSINADTGGFHITVAGNTDLKGGLISSAAAAGKNRLETGTITTAQINNYAKAEAKSSGFVLPAGALSQGKYGIIKTIVANLLNDGSASSSFNTQTTTAISNGTIVITNEAGQIALTGSDAQQTIALLNRDTKNAHNAVGKIDIKKLEKDATDERELKQFYFNKGVKYTDDAYNTMFVIEHPVYVIETDADGNILYKVNADGEKVAVSRKLTDEEKQNMQKGTDGKILLSMNGIMNNRDEAANYAVQHITENGVVGPIYFVWFPKAESAIGELLVAAYQKFVEDDFSGLTNSTNELVSLAQQYGADGLDIYAHSRGGMTVGNALESLENGDNEGVMSNTDIHFFGPAYNAQKAADMLAILSGGTKDHITLENHEYDIVGRLIGGNPSTSPEDPSQGFSWDRLIEMYTGKSINVHLCYGLGKPACGDGDFSNNIDIYSTNI